jgi:2-keto-4-pentenoate hydratase
MKNNLTDDQVRAAADLLVAARQKRIKLANLPAELVPEDTYGIQRIINAVSAQIDRPVKGWKTYCFYKPMNAPFYAPVYDVFKSGDTIPNDVSPGRLAEPEVMFRLDKDLPARDNRYEVAEVAEAVTCVLGFELIGSRFSYELPHELTGEAAHHNSLCDHIANGALVIGDAVPGWRDIDFEDVRLRFYEDGRELVSVRGVHGFDNPFLPVVVGVNRLRRHTGAKKGDIILTQSSTSFFPIKAGSTAHAIYEGLGEVKATFAEA